MGLIDDSVRITVRHRIHSETWIVGFGMGVSTTYTTTSVRVQRPERESRLVQVRCHQCDAVLSLRVHNARHTIRKRWLWAAMVAASLLLLGLVFAIPISAGPLMQSSWSYLVLVYAGALGSVGLCMGLGLTFTEKGIRLESSSSDALHSLR